jgi:hypothetical protein
MLNAPGVFFAEYARKMRGISEEFLPQPHVLLPQLLKFS